MTASKVNWEDMVALASQHLMLPALYCQLKTKEVISYIPQDLNDYLEELTAINRNRNAALLKEALDISEVLNAANIDHVFIKGVALIAGNTYKDIGERMIGDIDILIARAQLQEAFNLLENYGYTENYSFNYEQKNFRHLSRQINPDKIGAVELHSEVLVHNHRALCNVDAILKNKRNVNGIYLPSIEDAIRMAIFTTQINDQGHVFGLISLKNIYDCLSLGLQNNIQLLNELSNQKQSQSFLEISGLFFSELKPLRSNSYSKFLKTYFSFCMQHPRIGQLSYQMLHFAHSYWERMKLLIGNKSYRTHILKNKIIVPNSIFFKKPNT